MPKKVFTTPEGTQVEDEAVEVELSSVSIDEPVVWDYDDPELTVRRVILDPQGVRLWKARNEMDRQGTPLMSFEPHFDAVPRKEYETSPDERE